MNTNMNTDEKKASTFSLRGVFEHAACALGIVAAVATGLAPHDSAFQASTAICMATAFATAYILKR